MRSAAWLIFQLAVASGVAWLAVQLPDRRPNIAIVICMFFAAWVATRFVAWLIDTLVRACAGQG